MTAHALVSQARGLGVRLYVEGDRIKALPAGKLPPDLKDAIRAAKAEVVALLAAEPPAYTADARVCAGCGRSGFTLMVSTSLGDHFCRGCWRATAAPPEVRQPATPTLDALMRQADERAEREGA